jgi:flagellar protein FliO/FliZ
MSASAGLNALMWFLLIVLLIPAVLWLLKRTPLGGGLNGVGLRTVGVLPLSAHQRIVTVEVGEGPQRRWLVLGITPNTITTLHTFESAPWPGGVNDTDFGPDDGADPATPAPESFAQRLRSWTQRPPRIG